MKLLGVSTLAELEPRHVTQLTRLMPLAGAPAEAAGGGAPRVRVATGAAARAPRSTANGKADAPPPAREDHGVDRVTPSRPGTRSGMRR